ncbi:shikimate kinase [Robertkochia solimangrovi]|uniref:shikimate kinase n=1 Tax=Robertkochia solimangrovi TaxID=2213046 RepID=UPI00117CA8F3|nr:shikimate kinase [Robertkochia solimangrovi]TRZ41582.1 shikimate kinase [Robertkochia solimangrovi]
MVILIGYMGSGKSTVGKILASEMKIEFMDFDDYIEKSEGMSIPEIFSSKGEIYFRKIESSCLQTLLQESPDAVISLGGGTPCFGNNMDNILEASDNVFYLKAGIEFLVERLLPEKSHRPLISAIDDQDLSDFIRKHLFERNFYYMRSPNVITTDRKSPAAIAGEIAALI